MAIMRDVFVARSLLAVTLIFGCHDNGGSQEVSTDSATESASAPCEFRESVLPMPSGPYCVGAVDYHWVDPHREEPFTPDDALDTREVEVRIFYPAPSDADEAFGDYLSPKTAHYLAEAFSDPEIEARIEEVAVQFRMEAPLAETEKPFPGLLYSPGHESIYQVSTALLEDLASHGYVVVAVNHPYFSLVTELPEDRIVEVAYPFIEDRFSLVVGDMGLVLDKVLDLAADDPSGRFTGRLDTGRLGAFGHSMGGAASLALLQTDNRVRAGIDMDGTLGFPGMETDPVSLPVMLHLAGRHTLASDFTLSAFSEQMAGPGYVVTVGEAEHVSYTEMPLLAPLLFPGGTAWEMDSAKIDPVLMIELVRAYNAAFFDVHLQEAPLETLTSLVALYPEAALFDVHDFEPEQDTDSETDTDTQFTCASTEVIPAMWECDGEPDCEDGSDEHDDCIYFTCASGDQVIHLSWKCDGEPDCDDGSDEGAGCV